MNLGKTSIFVCSYLKTFYPMLHLKTLLIDSSCEFDSHHTLIINKMINTQHYDLRLKFRKRDTAWATLLHPPFSPTALLHLVQEPRYFAPRIANKSCALSIPILHYFSHLWASFSCSKVLTKKKKKFASPRYPLTDTTRGVKEAWRRAAALEFFFLGWSEN